MPPCRCQHFDIASHEYKSNTQTNIYISQLIIILTFKIQKLVGFRCITHSLNSRYVGANFTVRKNMVNIKSLII